MIYVALPWFKQTGYGSITMPNAHNFAWDNYWFLVIFASSYVFGATSPAPAPAPAPVPRPPAAYGTRLMCRPAHDDAAHGRPAQVLLPQAPRGGADQEEAVRSAINTASIEMPLYWLTCRLQEGVRALSLEGALEARERGAENTVSKREAELEVVELLGGSAASILSSNLLDIHNLNAREASTVTSSHVAVCTRAASRPAHKSEDEG